MPITPEIVEQQWMEKVAPPTRYGTVYGMANQAFRQFSSSLQGIGATNEGAMDPKEYQTMKQQISQLTTILNASEARMLGHSPPTPNLPKVDAVGHLIT
ncbi:hypothetical protein RND71_037516 [Anisodus tanguticus]|uniref:Uncharacterized protein n=1 Tax=Anisodus tanguticus TaxID=243964 RepID=A0AAE1UV29_9SOLA|nr:hypothetical protein RND71_037516 [Anisodus tanguticus]